MFGIVSHPWLPSRHDSDPPPVNVERFWDRHGRYWVLFLVDANGYQVGDADYAPNRAAMEQVWSAMMRRIPPAPSRGPCPDCGA